MVSRVLLSLLLFASSAAWAAELEGVKLPDRVVSAGQELQLNGIGLRRRIIFRVYVAGLYLVEKAQTGEAAITMRGAKRMTLVMLRDVGAEQFGDALLVGLRNNVPEAELAALKPQVDELMARIAQIGEAKKGSTIDLDYSPGQGTVMKVNGEAKGAPIQGEAFFRALLRTWVGEKPAQQDLKKALLGEAQ
jgi:hypothetical protein